MSLLVIKVAFDCEASVWYVSDSDIPGLATEAASFDALREKLLIVAPELLDANGIATAPDEIPVDIVVHDTARFAQLWHDRVP